MRVVLLLLTLLVPADVYLCAATPSAEQLLPTDTLALVSIPDWDQAVASWKESAQGKLWSDAALKPFKEKLYERWREEWTGPLERQMGIKLADYADLPHGQVTFALIQNGWGIESDGKLGFVLLLDTKDKQELLKNRLSEFKQKWIDSGKQQKTEKIRELDFTTLILTGEDLSNLLDKVLPASKEEKDDDDKDPAANASLKSAKTEIVLGQSGSLLIVANDQKTVEKILVRQTGGLLPALADQGHYQANHSSLFREAKAFAWLNFAVVYDHFRKQMSRGTAGGKETGLAGLSWDRILAATGLGGVGTLAARLNTSAEGLSAGLFVGVPEARRRGLLDLAATEHKEAGPPTFVRADVMKFRRWRLNGRKAWTTVENLLTSISPEMAGLVQLGLEAAGKDRDPDFNLKKALLDNLGEDLVSVQKSPHSSDKKTLNAPAPLYLVGSPTPEQFVQALKVGTALMPLAGAEPGIKEREFLGHRIYSLALSGLEPEPGKAASSERSFSFAATAGYAAMSTDASVLEEYLRSSESAGQPLRETPGLSEAAQKVAGTSTGFFGYENTVETARLWLEGAKSETAALDKLLSLTPLAGDKSISPEEKKKMTGWFDFTLMPPFETISKYFSFLVYSLNSSKDGITFQVFMPTPAALKHGS
jgi:hypothetical protein